MVIKITFNDKDEDLLLVVFKWTKLSIWKLISI
jgi:hypothetical protein